MLSRRRFAITGTSIAALVVALRAPGYAAGKSFDEFADTLVVLERESGGRLGVAVLDTKTGHNAGYRDTELFPLASTFKLLAAAAVLSLVDAGKTNLDTRVVFQESEVVTYSPVTKSRFGGNGMSLSELCEAAITLSDNTAGNMLLRALGGPAGLTSYARTIGDPTTRHVGATSAGHRH